MENQKVSIRAPAFKAPFELWIAVAAIYSGLSNFLPLPPTGSGRVVALAFPFLASIWSTCYAVGGLLVSSGLLRKSLRLELAGLHLLGAGLIVAFMASLLATSPILPTFIIQGGVIAACYCRIFSFRRLI